MADTNPHEDRRLRINKLATDKAAGVVANIHGHFRDYEDRQQSLYDGINRLRAALSEIAKIPADDHGNAIRLAKMIAGEALDRSSDL